MISLKIMGRPQPQIILILSICIRWTFYHVGTNRERALEAGSRNKLLSLKAKVNVLNLFFLLILVKYERIKFLVIALKNAVEIYAWAPKPYHKFMAFKVRFSGHQNTLCSCKYTRFLYNAEQKSVLLM